MLKHLFTTLLCAIVALVMALPAGADTLYGLSRDYNSGYGLVTIDTQSPTGATVVKAFDVMATAGAIKDSTIYFTGFDDDFNTLLYKTDLQGNLSKIKNLGEDAALPMEMAYDYNGETMYFVTNSDRTDGMSALWTFNLTNGAMTKVTDNMGIFVRGLAVDAAGNMVAINGGGDLYSVNQATGASTRIGSTGLGCNSFQSLAFDQNTGVLYFANRGTDYVNRLYTIDVTTAAATSLGNIGSGDEGMWVVGLSAPYAPSAITAPDRATDLNVVAGANGALTATITWTNPTVMTNGEALDAISSIEVLRDGEVIATLTGEPGQQMTYTDTTVPAAGNYRYSVRVYNEAGPSADRWMDAWIGGDVPAAVGNPRAELVNSTTNAISWEAPTTGAHGGYIEVAELTYDIIRANDGKVVASDVTWLDTQDTQLFDKLTRYTYYIVAKNANGAGDTIATNYLVNGPARQVPFEADFNDADEALLWTVINQNNDETTYLWHYDVITQRYYYMYQASEYMNANDWLISPPIEFQEGQEYKITVKACNDFAPYPENFRIYSTAGYTTAGAVPIEEEFTCDDANVLHEYVVTLTAEDDGYGTAQDLFTSFLSVTCTSPYDRHIFMVASVKVELMNTSAVTELDADAANAVVDVYTIDGRAVLRGVDASSVNTLPTGLYIINNGTTSHKVMVK